VKEKESIEVKEKKYLGYILQKNRGAKKYIRERIKRTTVERTWSIGGKKYSKKK